MLQSFFFEDLLLEYKHSNRGSPRPPTCTNSYRGKDCSFGNKFWCFSLHLGDRSISEPVLDP